MTKETFSRGQWIFAAAVLIVLVVLVSVLPPSAEVSESLTVGGSQDVTLYQAIACFAVMVAAVFGSAVGGWLSRGRLVHWLSAVCLSLPLGLWVSYRLTQAGYPEFYLETTAIVLVICSFIAFTADSDESDDTKAK